MIFKNVRFLNESIRDIVWDYVTDIDYSVFEEIEKEFDIKFPSELKSLFNTANAGRPNKNLFKVKNVERVFGSLFSLNKDENDSIYTPISVFKKEGYDNYIPIGTDPAGNFICYNIKNKNIEFWNHETGKFEFVSKSLDSFIFDTLYK